MVCNLSQTLFYLQERFSQTIDHLITLIFFQDYRDHLELLEVDLKAE